MPTISNITSVKLKDGDFKDYLPELFTLKGCIENNGWHNNDPVFDHTVAVLEEFEKLTETVHESLAAYLSQFAEANTKKDLIRLAILLHDIAKDDTIIQKGDRTACPKHEAVGAEKAKKILNRFTLTTAEKKLITELIRYHGEIHPILSSKNDSLEEQFEEYEIRHQDIFTALILIGAADTFASHLKENDPKEFEFRRNFYRRILKSL